MSHSNPDDAVPWIPTEAHLQLSSTCLTRQVASSNSCEGYVKTSDALMTPASMAIDSFTVNKTESPMCGSGVVESNVIWFLNDDRGYRQSVWCKAFPDLIRTLNFDLKQYRGRHDRERLLAQLKSTAPFLVWIRMPGQATQAGTALDARNAAFIVSIMRVCLRQDRPCLFESCVHNALLSQPCMTELISEGQVSLNKIRWCNFGIVHPQNSRPSNVKIAVLSNLKLPNAFDCQCGSTVTEHLSDARHDLDMYNNRDVRFLDCREVMTNQFILGLTCVVASDIMTHSTIKPELIKCFVGYRLLLQLDPCPLNKMSSEVRKYVENSNVVGRYQPLGPQEASKSPFVCAPANLINSTPVCVQGNASSFPTASRMKAKEWKELNPDHKPVKKKKHSEPGNDDCGEDHSAIMYIDEVRENSADLMCFVGYGLESDPEYAFELNHDCFMLCFEADLQPRQWLFGSATVHDSPFLQEKVASFAELNKLYPVCRDDGTFVDCVEFCGGTARTSAVLIRRRYKVRVGKNFDLTTGINLLYQSDVNDFWEYMFSVKPLVVVLSPPCTGLSGFSALNRVVAPDGFHRSRLVSLPLGDLAGHVAQFQLTHGRHFIAEQPRGSELYTLPSWIPVANDPKLVIATPDMCMAGLTDPENPHLFFKKRCEVWASSEVLVSPLRKFKCDNSHEHSVIEGTHNGVNKSHGARVWTWKFAASVASGIAAIVRENHYMYCRAFQLCVTDTSDFTIGTWFARFGVYVKSDSGSKPRSDSIAVGTDPKPNPNDARLKWKCKGCQNNLFKEHHKHTRIPFECRYPDVESVKWECPACNSGKPRASVDHTLIPSECRWHDKDFRTAHNRSSKSEPKPPRIPVSSEPTSSLKPVSPLDELQAEEALAQQTQAEVDVPDELIQQWEFEDNSKQDKPGASSSSGLDRPQRKAESQPRKVVTKREAGAQASDPATDTWSAWDLGRSLQLLRSQNPAVVRRTLRMLHLRWWHASAKRMHDILQSTGVEIPVALIQEIVDTCRPCRTWARPGASAMSTSRNLTKFAEVVQHDLTFFEQKPIQHLICAVTRLSQACWLPSKTTPSLIDGIDLMWIRPYGPMDVLESDQESGLVNDESKVYFSRLGTELKLKGVNAHVRMLEKHHDWLRQQYLRTKTQCEEEGLNFTKERLLSVCLTAKNSLFTVGKSTPMQAVFGRQPAVLPNLEQGDALLDDTNTGPDGVSRHSIRLREIALDNMIQTTAVERAARALRSKTRRSGHDESYVQGDKVEIYRAPANKDTSGWRGPCEVSSVADDGTVHVRWQGSALICRPPDVRRALTYFLFLSMFLSGSVDVSHNSPLDVLRRYVMSMNKCMEFHGIVCNRGIYCLSKVSIQSPVILHAILHIAACGLHLAGCIGARIGHNVRVLEGVSFVDDSVLWWWLIGSPNDMQYVHIPATKRIVLSNLHPDFAHVCFVQFLLARTSVVDEIRNHVPSVPHLGGPLLPDVENIRPMDTGTVDRGIKRPRSQSEISENPAPHVMPAWPPSLPQATSPIDDTEAHETPVPDSDYEDMESLYVSDYECMYMQDSYCSDNNTFYTEEMESALRDPEDPCEFVFDLPLAYWLVECPEDISEGDLLIFRVSDDKIECVIERESRTLTREEEREYKVKVDAAKLVELLKWHELKTFRRLLRSEGSNILDGRWVLTWKQMYVAPTSLGGKPTFEWIVKARLTARGFKDLQISENKVATYSGTANRVSQRLINSQAAQTKTTLFSYDIGTAFLRGVTFREMAKRSGTPLRVVQFDFPAKDVHLLRKVPGMADFNHVLEVLDFLKSMWGLNDAPRLFGITRDDSLKKADCRKTSADSHFWVMHNEKTKKWELSVSTHIDDLKGCGDDRAREKLKKQLALDFSDDLKEQLSEFEHVGIKHVQNTVTYEVYTHQNHYVEQLHPINIDLVDRSDETVVLTGVVYSLFRSLLGALQWLLQTRGDIVPYVGCLQRHANSPTVKHVTMINRVLRWCKHNKTGILYSPLAGPLAMAIIADSAYKCEPEDDDCLALRGFIIALIGRRADRKYELHILEVIGSKHRLITRSTFAAELRNAIDAVDHGIKINGAVHEQLHGVVVPTELAKMKEDGGFALPVILFIDAKSVFDAVKSDNDNSADKSMLFHVKALRHQYATGQLDALVWLDTRDMLADGLTKGKIDRSALMKAMNSGCWKVEHSSETWRPENATKEIPWRQ